MDSQHNFSLYYLIHYLEYNSTMILDILSYYDVVYQYCVRLANQRFVVLLFLFYSKIIVYTIKYFKYKKDVLYSF